MGLFKEEQAVRPNNPFFNIPRFVNNEKAKEEGLTDEERILAAGSVTEFYKTLKEYIESVIEELDNANVAVIDSGASLEQIGENTKVLVTTKGLLKQIFNKVQDAREAVEAASGRGS